MATVPGIDVSYWNAGIDWPKVRAAGQRFVFAKATEGDYYADPTFDDNWRGAKAAGFLRGAYHFFRANVDAKKQANKFIDYVRSMSDTAELPPVLDLETHDNQGKEKIITRARTWLDLVEEAFNRKPMIYSGQYFLQDHFSEAGGGPPSWAKEYPLWLAQYPNVYVPGSQPVLPRGWFTWTFWQYSERGRINGINANVDLNLFNGSLEDLYKFAGAEVITEKPETQPKHTVVAGDSFETIANKYGVTVRELVSVNPQLLKTGDQLTVPVAIAIPSENGGGSTGGGSGSAPSRRSHTVRTGENLTIIAIKYGTTVAAIASANNIANINNISVGQVLIIP
ncbi:MAG TPA: GH25 family lysozyme [Anaerolineales bacterium]|nr:GH25 family lysozyme [Anaerolineales bacterium]